MVIKIASWNVCLGLKNKKEVIYQEIRDKNIDICLLQEVEITKDYNANLLTSKNYKIEVEDNEIKARCAIIIKDNLEYARRSDLEDINMGIVIVDILGCNQYRLVNIYRSFNPSNGMTPIQFFKAQLSIVKRAVLTANNKKILISGDFNLDDSKRFSLDYRNKLLFEHLNEICDELNLIQLIDQPTWKRIINNVEKKSVLDHVYVKDPNHVDNIEMHIPLFGDHNLITFEITAKNNTNSVIIRRNWSLYTKEKLINALVLEPFNIETDTVQQTWNLFENTLLNLTDKLAPLEQIIENNKQNSNVTSLNIKRKICLRRRLLNKIKNEPSNTLRDRIKNLNVEIKLHFAERKTNSIRKSILPGNSKSLWDAVKKAKDINNPKLPPKMTLNDLEIPTSDLPDTFANFFKDKVSLIINEQVIDDSVHNGHRKLWTTDHHFMSIENIVEAVQSMKNKNCEGHDRIPQKIIKDGIEWLKYPLAYLFNQIYSQKKIPEQWLIAKITPIFKKGSPSQIEN